MADIELIGVPFDGYGRAGHQARAAGALRDAGLRDAFDHHHVIDDDDLALPDPDPARGASTSLINERALLAMTDALNRKVGEVVGAGRFPFVYGGDCSTLLGIVTGLRDHVGDVGLVFIDGHEDTMPLDVSEDGEAANTEIGLLLGLTGRLLTGELGDRLPALRPEQLVILGPRDDAVAAAVQCRHARRFPGVAGPARRSRRRSSRHRTPAQSSSCPATWTGGGCTSTSTCSIPSSSPPRACPTSTTNPAA